MPEVKLLPDSEVEINGFRKGKTVSNAGKRKKINNTRSY